MNNAAKVALIGAGAIGAYFIHGFEGCEPELLVIAEGERASRLISRGITVNGATHHPVVMSAAEAGICDLVIIATKYTALDEAIELTKLMCGKDTIVLSVLNGIDSEERVAAAIGKEHVLHSLMKISSRRYPDRVEFQEAALEGVLFGNIYLPEEAGKLAVAKVDAILSRTNVAHKVREDIGSDIWFKYAGNVSSNLPQAVFGLGNGIYTDSEHAAYIRSRLWREVRALAAVNGVDIPEFCPAWKVAKSSRFSTLQDLDMGRPTEIEMFAGVLVRKSREAGLEAPFAEFVYHAIRLLEEKNTGKFNYTD